MKSLILFLALAGACLAAPPTMEDPVPSGYKRRMLLLDAGDVADTRPLSASFAVSTWTLGLWDKELPLGNLGSASDYRYTTQTLAVDGVDWPVIVEVSGWGSREDTRTKERQMREHLRKAVEYKSYRDALQTYPGLTQAQKGDLDSELQAVQDVAKAGYDALWAELNP